MVWNRSTKESGLTLAEPQAASKRFWPKCRRSASRIKFLVEEGVVEILDPRLFRVGREWFCEALVEEMVGACFAQRAEIRLASATCRVEFEPGLLGHDELARKVAQALKAASIAKTIRSTSTEENRARWFTSTVIASSEPDLFGDAWRLAEPVSLAISNGSIFANNPNRLVNLTLAGGSLAMAAAGAVLPGIPSLPFLVLTGHYLVRLSPELCRNWDNVPGIGTWLRKASEVELPSIDRRSFWALIGCTVAAFATLVMFNPPLPIVLLLEAGIMAYYGYREYRQPARLAVASRIGSKMAALA